MDVKIKKTLKKREVNMLQQVFYTNTSTKAGSALHTAAKNQVNVGEISESQ